MLIKANNTTVNYIQYGEGKDIILLHGWGQNIEMMKPIGDNLCSNHRITILDLPGFGESPEPPDKWTLDDYMVMLEDFVSELKIKKLSVSFETSLLFPVKKFCFRVVRAVETPPNKIT